MTTLGTAPRRALRLMAAAALAGIAITSLQGCVALVAGGVVMSTMAATDRRTLGAQAEDQAIEMKVQPRINGVVAGAGQINATSYNRRVLLTGEVVDAAMRERVEQVTRSVENVREVFNEVELSGAASLTSRSSDALITAQVKASLVEASDLYANAIKVVTERGTVYLLGRVTAAESQRAGEVASRIKGVQRVVKIFEPMSEEALRAITKPPGKTNAG